MSDFQLFLICLGIAGIVYFTLVPPVTLKRTPKRYGNRSNDVQPEIDRTHDDLEKLMSSIKTTHTETTAEHAEMQKTRDEMLELLAAINAAHDEVHVLKNELREENYLHEQVLRGLLIESDVLKKLHRDFPSSKYSLSSVMLTNLYSKIPESTLHVVAVCKETGFAINMDAAGRIISEKETIESK